MPSRLLKPKVTCRKYTFLTEVELKRVLSRLKQRKYGIKDYAVEVDEFSIEQYHYEPYSRGRIRFNPGTYFNVYIEYIV